MILDWQITLTDLIAFYAAIVSTSLLSFEIIKWYRSGPQITFSIQSDMNIINVPNVSEEKTFTVFKLTNKGDRSTTIETIDYRYYKNKIHYYLRKSSMAAVIGNTGFKPLPYVLEPGTNWLGVMDEIMATENYTKKGLFVFEASMSHQKNPITLKRYYHKKVN